MTETFWIRLSNEDVICVTSLSVPYEKKSYLWDLLWLLYVVVVLIVIVLLLPLLLLVVVVVEVVIVVLILALMK